MFDIELGVVKCWRETPEYLPTLDEVEASTCER